LSPSFLTEAFRSHRSLGLAKTELPAGLWHDLRLWHAPNQWLEVVVLSLCEAALDWSQPFAHPARPNAL